MRFYKEFIIDNMLVHSEWIESLHDIDGDSYTHLPKGGDGFYYFNQELPEVFSCTENSVMLVKISSPEIKAQQPPTPKNNSIRVDEELFLVATPDKETKAQFDRIEAMLVEAIAEKTCKCGL